MVKPSPLLISVGLPRRCGETSPPPPNRRPREPAGLASAAAANGAPGDLTDALAGRGEAVRVAGLPASPS